MIFSIFLLTDSATIFGNFASTAHLQRRVTFIAVPAIIKHTFRNIIHFYFELGNHILNHQSEVLIQLNFIPGESKSFIRVGQQPFKLRNVMVDNAVLFCHVVSHVCIFNRFFGIFPESLCFDEYGLWYILDRSIINNITFDV